MGAIVPAVLPFSKQDLEKSLSRLIEIDAVDTVQIDVIDGKFAAPANWPYAEGRDVFGTLVASGDLLPHTGRLRFEVDLMVHAPEEVMGNWISAGVSRVTIHAESSNHLLKVISDFRIKYGHDKNFAPGLLSLGLALGLESDLSLIDPYLEYIDYVQFMGIARIGRQGEPFDRRVLARIATFRKLHPEIAIQIDGGVTEITAPDLLSAGADRLVVGHDLLQAKDIVGKFNRLTKLAERYNAP